MKQYLKRIVKLFISAIAILSGTIPTAQAQQMWLDFAIADSNTMVAISSPVDSELVATTKPQMPTATSGVEAIALDFSVPSATKPVVEQVAQIPKTQPLSAPPVPKPPQATPTPAPTPIPAAKRQKIVEIANSWVGKKFKPGTSAQCAVFVREVFRKAGIPLAISQQPFDKAVQWIDAHPARAQSFFGKDVGRLITNKNDLQPGDLVGFANTYGNWPPGAITHVGIVVERRSDGTIMMVDRSTRSIPVKYRSISTFKFAVGVRPHAYNTSG